MAKCAKGIQNAHFCSRPKANALPWPTRKSTRDRGHHYSTHPTYSGTILVGERYCNWLKPPIRIATPTLTLYWVVLMNKVVGPNDPPVKKTREHSAAKQLWPNRDATTRFPARAWREGVPLLRAQRGCRWSRTALATPG